MGGQGGGVLSNWIVDVAEHNGYLAQATSVPGVAQRTGATIYYIELFPKGAAEQAGRDPVFALMPIPGEVDIVVAAELLEAGRAVLRGFVNPDRTTLIASSHRDYAIAEKMAMGNGIVDGEKVLEVVQATARRCVTFDMASLAAATDSVISSVLCGALAGAGGLPFDRKHYEDAIRRSGIAVDKSLAGFGAGFERATGGEEEAGEVRVQVPAPTPSHREAHALLGRVDGFPAVARSLVTEGVRRLSDYQDLAYAGAYLDALERILDLDDGGGDGSYRLTSETARHLALWMSYEDTIRVADLKTRAARLQRVRKEVQAEPHQLVYIVEFMHPGVEEICDTMPAPLGSFVMERRRVRDAVDRIVNRGRRVPTTSLWGFLLLYFVAGLRRWRRLTYRYQREMVLIDQWIEKILAAAPSDYDLAVEICRCQRLIKGYGDTHARGMKSFTAIMEALHTVGAGNNAGGRVRALRDAALADEDGAALDAALAATTL